MKRVVFLDFGGVTTTTDAEARGELFHHENVEALNMVLGMPETYIVITSMWRISGDADYFEELLTENGVHAHGKVIGTTPWMDDHRDEEIDTWMRMFGHTYGIERVVVLDDRADIHHPHLVRTNPHVGLTEADARLAVANLH